MRVYRRSKRGYEILYRQPIRTFGQIKNADITSLMKNDETVFIGRRNGSVKIISMDNNESDSDEMNVSSHIKYEQRVESIDFSSDLFVTTTLHRTALWKKRFDLNVPYLDLSNELGDGYKCLRLSPNVDRLALGKYKDSTRKALNLVDLET